MGNTFSCKIPVARAEDRATLESDLSADAGDYTDGQGLPGSAFHLLSIHLAVHKAVNSFLVFFRGYYAPSSLVEYGKGNGAEV